MSKAELLINSFSYIFAMLFFWIMIALIINKPFLIKVFFSISVKFLY